MTSILIALPWCACLYISFKDKTLFRKNLIVMAQSAIILLIIAGVCYGSYIPKSDYDFGLLPYLLALIVVFFLIGIVRLVKTVQLLKQDKT